MQKWEYMFVHVAPGKNGNTVLHINGQQVGELNKGEAIHSFLNRVGQEIWEAVGMTPICGQSYYGFDLLLKRPLL